MIELTPQQQQFVDSQIAAGIFSRTRRSCGGSFVLLEQRQSEYAELETAIGQVERGEYELLDMDDVKRRGNERKTKQ